MHSSERLQKGPQAPSSNSERPRGVWGHVKGWVDKFAGAVGTLGVLSSSALATEPGLNSSAPTHETPTHETPVQEASTQEASAQTSSSHRTLMPVGKWFSHLDLSVVGVQNRLQEHHGCHSFNASLPIAVFQGPEGRVFWEMGVGGSVIALGECGRGNRLDGVAFGGELETIVGFRLHENVALGLKLTAGLDLLLPGDGSVEHLRFAQSTLRLGFPARLGERWTLTPDLQGELKVYQGEEVEGPLQWNLGPGLTFAYQVTRQFGVDFGARGRVFPGDDSSFPAQGEVFFGAHLGEHPGHHKGSSHQLSKSHR